MAGFCHIVNFGLRTLVEEKKRKKKVKRKRGRKGQYFFFFEIFFDNCILVTLTFYLQEFIWAA